MRIADYPLALIAVFSFLALLGAVEAGHRYGLSVGKPRRENVSTLEGSILGLLALMIGFTFALALSRFEARRDALLVEVNAIGTAALRARMLPDPYSANSLKLLKSYVETRLDMATAVASAQKIAAAIDRSNAIQEGLWREAMDAASKNKDLVPMGLYIQALNDMIDAQQKRLTAFSSNVPGSVMLALYGIALVSSAFAGYAAGLDKQRSRFATFTAVTLFTLVILLIQDLDHPGAGLITVDQKPMHDIAATIRIYVK
jgi:hypothetical protein